MDVARVRLRSGVAGFARRGRGKANVSGDAPAGIDDREILRRRVRRYGQRGVFVRSHAVLEDRGLLADGAERLDRNTRHRCRSHVSLGAGRRPESRSNPTPRRDGSIVADGRCPAESFVIPSVETLPAADRHVDPQTAALEDQVASEVGLAAKAPLDPTPVTGAPPLTCDVPFADPSVDAADPPAFPPAAVRAGAFGSVAVRVELDQTGKVTGATALGTSGNPDLDAAAVTSARKSTYHPARFACEPLRSSYTVNFDFSK